jgi:peptide/nickel transport system substrate-binding protein
MDRFDGYWKGWHEDQFEKIVFQIVTDPVVAGQLMEGGEADFWRNPPPDRIESLSARDGLEVYVQPALQNLMLFLNTRKPPLDDPKVRQALAYSFPYADLMQRTGGINRQSRGAIPAGMWGHDDELYQYQYDLDKASALLAEAGYAQGGFELEITYPASVPIGAWAVELWGFSLRELGIEPEPRLMVFDALYELAVSDPDQAQDVAVAAWWPTWVTPYDWLANLHTCQEETFFNFSYWCNEEYDALVAEGDRLSATDRAAAEEKFLEAQRILLEESPVLFLFDLASVAVVSSDIEGFVENPAYQNVVFYHDLTVSR